MKMGKGRFSGVLSSWFPKFPQPFLDPPCTTRAPHPGNLEDAVDHLNPFRPRLDRLRSSGVNF